MEKNYQMKNFTLRYKIFFLSSGILSFILIAFILSQVNGGFLFPPIHEVIGRFFSLFIDTHYLEKFMMSLLRLLICLVISFLIALLLSYLRQIKKESSEFFTPFIVFLKCSPLAVLSIYLFLIFGANKGPYFIILSMIIPIMIEAFFTAQDSIPIEIKQELMVNDVSSLNKYFKVIFPLMLPNIAMSFLMCFGLGLKVAVMGEYLMQTPSSLGSYLYELKANLDIVTLLSVLLFSIFFTLIIDLLAKIIFKKLQQVLFNHSDLVS